MFVIFRKCKILTQRRRKTGVDAGSPWTAAVTGQENQQKGEWLLRFLNKPTGPLLGRDGLDDELPAILRNERPFRAVQCQAHQALNVGIVQYREIFQSEVPHYFSLALKTPFRVGEPGSLREAQGHPGVETARSKQ